MRVRYIRASNAWRRIASVLSLFATLLLANGNAAAENFVQVEAGDARTSYAFDTDSLVTDADSGSVYFTYRASSNAVIGSGNTALIYDAIASCKKFAITRLRTYALSNGKKQLVEESFLPGKGWAKRPYYNPLQVDKSAESEMLLQICLKAQPSEIRAMMEPPETGCPAQDQYESALCQLGHNNRLNLRLVKARLDIVSEFCGDASYLQAQFNELLQKVSVCGDRTNCFSASDFPKALGYDIVQIGAWLITQPPEALDKAKACQAKVYLEKTKQVYRDRAKAL